jgi:hypothetical protein
VAASSFASEFSAQTAATARGYAGGRDRSRRLHEPGFGSLSSGSSLGICHAELQAAVSRRPEIVFMVRLLPLNDAFGEADKEFQNYVNGLSLFQKDASGEVQLHAVVAEMMQNVVARLAARGSTAGSRKLDRGEALSWNRLNLADRRAQMRTALTRQLRAVSAVGRR